MVQSTKLNTARHLVFMAVLVFSLAVGCINVFAANERVKVEISGNVTSLTSGIASIPTATVRLTLVNSKFKTANLKTSDFSFWLTKDLTVTKVKYINDNICDVEISAPNTKTRPTFAIIIDDGVLTNNNKKFSSKGMGNKVKTDAYYFMYLVDEKKFSILNDATIVEGQEDGQIITIETKGREVIVDNFTEKPSKDIIVDQVFPIDIIGLPDGVNIAYEEYSPGKIKIKLVGSSNGSYGKDREVKVRSNKYAFADNVVTTVNSNGTIERKYLTVETSVTIKASQISGVNPAVATKGDVAIGTNAVRLLAEIEDEGTLAILEKGFVLASNDSSPDYNKPTAKNYVLSKDEFKLSLVKMSNEVVYYYRPYVKTVKGVVQGKVRALRMSSAASELSEKFLIPLITVFQGQKFSVAVAGGDDIRDGTTIRGITVINKSYSDGFAVLEGTLNEQGVKKLSICGYNVVLNCVAPPSQAEESFSFKN